MKRAKKGNKRSDSIQMCLRTAECDKLLMALFRLLLQLPTLNGLHIAARTSHSSSVAQVCM